MGDAQSAQREGKKDEAAEEESGKVDDAQAEQSTGDKPLKNIVQISEINEKAGISLAGVNGHCEDEVATDAVLSQGEDISETEIPLEEEEEEEEAPKHVERNKMESSNEVDVAEDVPLDMIEIDAKKNDINDGFRKFFSNIGLRLSIKRGSTDLLRESPDETNREEPRAEEPLEVAVNEPICESVEQNTDVNTAQVANDNDSTTCPTLTDISPEDVLGNAEEKATEAKEDGESDNADSPITLPPKEDLHQEATPEEEQHATSGQEEVVSPIKKFFTSGIFSGLRKKRRLAEEETNEKEMIDMGTKGAVEALEESEQNQHLDKVQIDPGIEAAAIDTENKENELQQEVLSPTSTETTDEGKPPVKDLTTHEALDNQEKDKVPSSPLKRLLSGSSFKKLSKRPRSRRSSESRLSDSGEQATDQLMSSTESAENHKDDISTQPSSEVPGEEDGAWASFKKLLTPKKRRRTPSSSNKEAEIQASAEKPKQSEGEQISDRSTEEDRKRKDSSVSWEAVLCGSGKKRSRKTSDSEDESPQVDNDNKQDPSSKHGAESPQEGSNERKNGHLVSSPRVHRIEGDGASTWITFKRLVTPKRKAKDEEESKDIIQSDGEVSQDESSFSIKKLLPGRKKRKSPEKQDQVSSDEADKDVPSGDEDSETPAVVPLSEFDIPESVVQIQTQVDIESHILEESDHKIPQDLLQHTPEPALPCDGPQNEAKAVENLAATTLAKTEELDEVSELISKHQQLSDITEEGIITETMPTPASANDEAGKDDTIAEDLIEITSEAFTAPEPASVTTLADETEMISAVSQLSTESSKTSGDTTPVPAEYEVMETDALLHQVVENISAAPKALPISSTAPKSESIVGSVLHQLFRSFVKEEKETTVLEIHKRSDATAIKTGQTVEELDAVNELAATAKIERVSEFNDSEPTEILPEVLEKLDPAGVTVDEVHPSLQEQSQSEASAAPVSEENVLDESSEVDVQMQMALTEPYSETQGETEKVHELEAEAAKLNSEEDSKQLSEQEVILADIPPAETITEEPKETEEISTEASDEPENVETQLGSFKDEHVQEPEVLEVVPATPTLEDGSVPSLEKEAKLEDASVAEIVTDELKEETLPLTEDSFELLDASTTEHVQEPEVVDAVQASSDPKVDNLSPEEVKPDGMVELEKATDEPKQEPEEGVQPDDKLLNNTAETADDQEPEELPSNVEDAGMEAKAEGDIFMDEHEVPESVDGGTTLLPLSEDTLEQVDTPEKEDIQEQELQTLQPSPLDLNKNALVTPEKVIPEDILAVETVTDEPQKETEDIVEKEETLQVEEVVSGYVEEPQVLSFDTGDKAKDIPVEEDASIDVPVATESVEGGTETVPVTQGSLESMDLLTTEQVKEPEELQTVQAPPFITEEPQQEMEEPQQNLQVADVKTENVPQVSPSVVKDAVGETLIVTEEPIPMPEVTESFEKVDTTTPPAESLEPVDLPTSEQIQVQEEVQTTQLSALYYEGGSLLLLEKISEDIHEVETVTEEPQEETGLKGNAQEKPQGEADLTEYVQKPEVLSSAERETVQETLHVEGATTDVPVVTETIEGGSVTLPVTELSIEPVNDSKAEDGQGPEAFDTVQGSPLASKVDGLLPLESVISKGSAAVEKVTEESTEETKVMVEQQEKIQVEDSAIENVQEPEVLQSVVEDAVKETLMEEGTSTPMPEVTESINVESARTPVIEGSPEPMISTTEQVQVQVQEDLKTVEASASDSTAATDEPHPATEVRVEDGRTENIQEPEEPLSHVKDVVQETSIEEGLIQAPVISESITEGSVTVPSTEISPESRDVERTEDKQKPEVIDTAEGVKSIPETSSLSPLEKAVSEDIPTLKTVMDEPQKDTEMIVEQEEKLEGVTTEYEKEPEELKSSVKDNVSTEEGATIPVPLPKEDVDEESASLPLTEQSLESADISKTEDFQKTEVLNTEQESPLVLDEANLPVLGKTTSVDIEVLEIVSDEPESEAVVVAEAEEKEPVKAFETEYVQEPEILPSHVKDTVTETLNEESVASDSSVATERVDPGSVKVPVTEESLKQEDASETEQIQIQEEIETVQELLDKEISEDIPAVETVVEEPQKDTEVDTQEKLQAEADMTENSQEPEVLLAAVREIIQETSAEKTFLVSEVAEGIDEGKETAPLSEQSPEPVNISKTENVQEPFVLDTKQEPPLDLEKGSLPPEKVISEDTPAVQTIIDEPQKETDICDELQDKGQAEASEPEYVLKTEVLPSDAEDTVTDIKAEDDASTDVHVAIESTEAGGAETQVTEELPSDKDDHVKDTKNEEGITIPKDGSAEKLESQILPEDVSRIDTDSAISSVTDQIEGEVTPQLDQVVEVLGGHKTEEIPQDVKVEQEDLTPEVAEELETKPQVHVSFEESNNVLVLEQTLLTEITQAPAVENPAITDESKHELNLSEVQVSDEREKESEHPSSETKAATLEHAIVPEVVTFNLKEVVATIPDVLTEKMTDITEPVMIRGGEVEEANTAAPLERDDLAVTAEPLSVAQMMHDPSGAFEDYHTIQMLEVEVTKSMEVLNVCHESDKKVENLSTTPDIEEELTHEETKATTQEIIQHVPDISPETASESEVAILEHTVTKLPDTVSQVRELAEPESTQKENQKEVDDGTESKDEVPPLISDDSAIPQQVSPKLEETKAEETKSAAGVTGEEVKSLSEEMDERKGHEPAQITHISQSLVATPSNTEFVIPQNTGIVSSVGKIESPSSLSLEFKLNIHFGQAKARPPPTTTERTEPPKKKDVSEIGVQAEEAAKPSEPTVPTQQAQSQEDTEQTEVNVVPTKITEPVTNLKTTAKAVITTQPVQQDVGIQTIETAETETKPPASPSAITERPNPVKEVDVSEVGVQEQTEINEVKDQATEISESAALQDSSAGEVIKTQPELLDLAIHADEAEELESKETAPPPVEEKDESVERVNASNAGVDVVELVEPVKPINLTQTADRHIQLAQSFINVQPADIIEPVGGFDSTESAALATGPEVVDVDTETPVAEGKTSPQLKEEETEQLTQTDVSEVGVKTKEAAEYTEPIHLTQRAESKIEPSVDTVHLTESRESGAHCYKEERAVIMTQPVLLDVAIHAIETVEVQSKVISSPPPIKEKAEDLTLPDVSRDEAEEPAEPITSTEKAEGQKQIEVPEVDDQATTIEEPEEPLGSTERAAVKTHPMLLDIGSHIIETEEPMAEAPATPPTTKKSEDLMLTNVSEVEVHAKEAVEPAEPVDLTQRAESKIEPIEFNIHSTEMEDSVAHIDSTERPVIMTHPVLLDLAVHATETVEVESKAPASPPPITERTEALTPTDVSNDEVQAVEAVEPAEPITPTEGHTQIELPEAYDQATETAEPQERPVITTQQVSLDADIHTTEMIDSVANAPDASTVSVDIMAPLKQTDVSDPDTQAEEAAEGQNQSALTETSLQATGITEPEVSFDLTQKAVITTHPTQLDDDVYTMKTVEVEDVEEEKADEETKSGERVTSSFQSTDKIQEEVFLSGPVQSEADDQETKVEKKHANNPEEENDQDVWMDAEEGVYTQEETEVFFQEVEEHLDSKAESVQGEEAAPEEEVEITPNVQTEEEESKQEVYETEEACDNESEGEGEDFAIALEHQEFAAGTVTTVEWD